ncbi:MAG: hypothetical protein IJ705_02895 [Oscillospiraceae bacterium]|nr:hypothetical protein [Oscillospiraceae bacterium]
METMLAMLKVDLGLTTEAYDERLAQYLTNAGALIEKEGVPLDRGELRDQSLIVMYAAWLWRKRDEMGEMPRMLRFALNNRVCENTMGEAEA